MAKYFILTLFSSTILILTKEVLFMPFITLKNSVFLAVVVFALNMPAEAISMSDAVGKVLSFMPKAGKAKICRKGNASSGVFSVRSFEGIACGDKTIAAFALKYCGGFEDFNQSSCATKAKKAIGGGSVGNVEKVLGDELTKATADEKEAICSNLDPEDMTPKQAKACANIGKD